MTYNRHSSLLKHSSTIYQTLQLEMAKRGASFNSSSDSTPKLARSDTTTLAGVSTGVTGIYTLTFNKVWYRSHTEPLFKSNQILKFEDMYTMQISLFVYDLNNDLLPKSFRNVLSQNCLARHGIITRQNNLIPQSRPRTTFSSKLPKHNFTRIWNKTGSTLAHGKNRLTFKRLLKNSNLEAYRSQKKCFKPR